MCRFRNFAIFGIHHERKVRCGDACYFSKICAILLSSSSTPLAMHYNRLYWLCVYLLLISITMLATTVAYFLTLLAAGAAAGATESPRAPQHVGPSITPDAPPVTPNAPTSTPDLPKPHFGKLELLSGSSTGVPAMHAAAMLNGKVMFLDKIENYTQLRLPNGQLAYSSMYDPNLQTVRPLAYSTNAFCCGGAFLPDGRLVTVGGNGPLYFIDPTVSDGFDGIRWLGQDDDS